jgi:flagellar motor switch protein FliM
MSTKEVLSESELDALMDSVSSGDVDIEDDASGKSCEIFDFSTREQVLLAQMPALVTINEKHSLGFTQAVRELFRVPAEVVVGEIQLTNMDEAIAQIPEPSGINVLKINPLIGVSVAVLPGELLSYFVDGYFGGTPGGSGGNLSARTSLTPTERRINDVLLEKFLTTLVSSWSGKIPLSTETVSFETKPEFLQVGSPGELALRFPFVIQIGDWRSTIDWLVPYAAFEALRPKLGNATARSNTQSASSWEDFFRRELLSINLEVRGVFTTRNVSIAEVLSLKRGSIVPLKMPSEVSIWSEGQLISNGEHGALNGNKSIKITEVLHK